MAPLRAVPAILGLRSRGCDTGGRQHARFTRQTGVAVRLTSDCARLLAAGRTTLHTHGRRGIAYLDTIAGADIVGRHTVRSSRLEIFGYKQMVDQWCASERGVDADIRKIE